MPTTIRYGSYVNEPDRLSTLRTILHFNLERVKALLLLYDTSGGQGGGRKPERASDLLRAAVVMLYATLEECARQSCAAFFPVIKKNPKFLAKVKFYVKRGSNTPCENATVDSEHQDDIDKEDEKKAIDLVFIAQHSGDTIDQFLVDTLEKHLSHISFTSPEKLYGFLASFGICLDSLDKGHCTMDLEQLMLRRHRIVHNADLSFARGRGLQRTSSLQAKTVKKWLLAVEQVTGAVLRKVEEQMNQASPQVRPEVSRNS